VKLYCMMGHCRMCNSSNGKFTVFVVMELVQVMLSDIMSGGDCSYLAESSNDRNVSVVCRDAKMKSMVIL
jgi:hypothetical protein